MWDAVVGWLGDNYPLLLLLVVVAVAVWLLARFYYTRFKRTEDKVAGLPCSRHEDMFREVKDELMQIMMFLKIKNPKMLQVFSDKHSPRVLNKAGMMLYNDIGGDEFLRVNGEVLLGRLEAKRPKTALDVETGANEVLIDSLNDDMFNGIKNWVYESPARKVMIDGEETDYVVAMSDICFILSIPLRDMYLERHPELNVPS